MEHSSPNVQSETRIDTHVKIIVIMRPKWTYTMRLCMHVVRNAH